MFTRLKDQTLRLTRFVLISICLVTVACGPVLMYPGPKRPQNQTATLEIGEVTLMMFDETPVGPNLTRPLGILPGEHFLLLSHNQKGYPEQFVNYTFTAEAGHRYLLDANYEIKRSLSWRPWVKDLTSGEVVGQRKMQSN